MESSGELERVHKRRKKRYLCCETFSCADIVSWIRRHVGSQFVLRHTLIALIY